MALASSTRLLQRLRSSGSTCIRLQKDSMTALSKQSPPEPIDGGHPRDAPEARPPRDPLDCGPSHQFQQLRRFAVDDELRFQLSNALPGRDQLAPLAGTLVEPLTLGRCAPGGASYTPSDR
jgi:hypothetical protein